MIRRVNSDFVPVALKAALVNNPGDDEEGRLYREIARSGKSAEGFYTHLWVRDAAGRWRIAYDIGLPATR